MPTKFDRVRDHYHRLVELGSTERNAVLADIARTDQALHEELSKLLKFTDESDLVPPASLCTVGDLVGNFKLISHLGSGGMGEVFSALRLGQDFDQIVALKMMRFPNLSAELTRRFIRERKILARLNHPDIAHLIDGGVDSSGRPFLAMELIDGLPINQWCEAHRTTLKDRIGLLLRICKAVQFAHERLIIHRDIKPNNILVDHSGQPHLLDFGVAKILSESAEETAHGLSFATPRYAAPEQLLGQEQTIATDVYALGILLYEVCAGGSPYQAAQRGDEAWPTAALKTEACSLHDVALASASDSVISKNKSRDLQRIASKAISKDSKDRYATVLALADDLQDFQNGLPLRSGAGSQWEDLGKIVRKFRWPIAFIGTVILMLTVGLVVVSGLAVEAEKSRASAEKNLATLLEVLSESTPENYTGIQPSVSDRLIKISAVLSREFRNDAPMLTRSMSYIGNGLLNLGNTQAARQILAATWVQVQNANTVTTEDKLNLLRLLVFALDNKESSEALTLITQRVSQIAQMHTGFSALCAEVLANAANTFAKHENFASSNALFLRVDELAKSTEPLSLSAEENILRQRGWAALRQVNLQQAKTFFLQSLAIANANPKIFSASRRAEAELFLAEIELLSGTADSAIEHFENALPTMQATFPADHYEYGLTLILQARINLALGNKETALSAATAGYQILGSQSQANPDELYFPTLVLAAANASRADCVATASLLRALTIPKQLSLKAKFSIAQINQHLRSCKLSAGLAP